MLDFGTRFNLCCCIFPIAIVLLAMWLSSGPVLPWLLRNSDRASLKEHWAGSSIVDRWMVAAMLLIFIISLPCFVYSWGARFGLLPFTWPFYFQDILFVSLVLVAGIAVWVGVRWLNMGRLFGPGLPSRQGAFVVSASGVLVSLVLLWVSYGCWIFWIQTDSIVIEGKEYHLLANYDYLDGYEASYYVFECDSPAILCHQICRSPRSYWTKDPASTGALIYNPVTNELVAEAYDSLTFLVCKVDLD